MVVDSFKGLEKKISESDSTSPCMQKKATGNCRAFIPSFFFDTQTGECTSFTYTGCGGNDNNFSSEDECDLKCNGLQGPVTPPSPQVDPLVDAPASDAGNYQFISYNTKCVANLITYNSIFIYVIATVATQTSELTRQEKCSLPPVNPSPFSCLAFIP